jgi:cytochrome P450
MTGSLPPGPRGLAAILAVRRARTNTISTFESWRARWGDAVMARVGARRLVLISDPELVSELLVVRHRDFHKSRTLRRASVLLGNGLLTSEGDTHLRQRRLVQPAFHRERVAHYADTMLARATALRDAWREGQVVDIHAEMTRLTLAIAALTLFSASVDDEADAIGAALTDAMNAFDSLKSPWWPLLDRLPLPATRRVHAARARLDATIRRIIRERREHPSHPDDLLSLLLSARDAEGGRDDVLDDEQIRDEVLTLFLAGHETTANALTWSWLLLAEHPEVALRLDDELRRVLGGRAPVPADLPALAFTRAVLTESMRLYPPAWIVGREAIRDTTIGPWRLPVGTVIFASQRLIHRDPRFFPEPLAFRPDRWLGDVPDAARRAYFPFGAGVRKCIGEAFAWTEGTLVLATLAQQWRMVRTDSAPVPILPQITLRPARAVPVRLERV